MMHGTPTGYWMMGMMWLTFLLLLLILAGIAWLLVRALSPGRASAVPPEADGAPGAPPSPPEDLDDDAARIYALLREHGGSLPQSKLVAMTGFPKARVSRVLDRLEARGLVTRLREGMGNRVVLRG